MRLIDADALIKILEPNSMKNGAVLGWHSSLIDAVIDEIRKMPTISGWTSVKDGLPKVDKSILYCAFGRSVGEGVYCGFDGRHHVWNMYAVSGTHWDNEVTHWMPLPEPPEKEK